ncbi:hypothetical protein FQN54_007983 [Arachnomyces sp. PD_36]|nr:hypothetical protein FQN54_007983 [Arachnomyces sp. PD_36]
MELLDLPTEILQQILSYNLCFKKDWCADPYRSKFLARRRVCRTFDIIVSRFTIPLLDLGYLLDSYHWTWSVESITWVLATEVATHHDSRSPLVIMIRRAAETLGQVIGKWETDTSQEHPRSRSSHFMMDLWKEVSGAVVINQGTSEVIWKLLCQRGVMKRGWTPVELSQDYIQPVNDSDILSILAWYGDAAIVRWFMDDRQVDLNSQNHWFGLPLYIAAAAGHTEIVSFLLERNANVNEEGGIIDPLVNAGADLSLRDLNRDCASLTAVVGEEAEEMAQKLLNADCVDCSLDDAWEWTLANHAGEQGLITLVRSLLGNEVVDASCKESTAPLHFAIRCFHQDVSQAILSEYLDVRALQKREDGSPEAEGDSEELSDLQAPDMLPVDILLSIAKYLEPRDLLSFTDSTNLAPYLTTRHILESRNEEGETILHLVASQGRHDLIRLFPRQVFQRGTSNNVGVTPLHTAIRVGDVDTTRSLIDAGSDVNARDNQGHSAVLYAYKHDMKSILQLLLERGADPCSGKDHLETLMYQALEAQRLDIIQMIIDSGSDVKSPFSDKQFTPLMWATSLCFPDAVKLLLDAGSDPSIQHTNGGTALHLTSWRGFSSSSSEIVRLLLDYGADTSVRDNDGDTPLMSALNTSHMEMARLLIDSGCDLFARDHVGRGVLHYVHSDTDMVKLLLASGVDPLVRDDNGQTAADITINDKVRKVLQEAEAAAIAARNTSANAN